MIQRQTGRDCVLGESIEASINFCDTRDFVTDFRVRIEIVKHVAAGVQQVDLVRCHQSASHRSIVAYFLYDAAIAGCRGV